MDYGASEFSTMVPFFRADDLRMIAEKYGEVRDVYIPRDFFTKRPKGLAFVEFTEAGDCQAACDDMEGMEVEGQPVRPPCEDMPALFISCSLKFF